MVRATHLAISCCDFMCGRGSVARSVKITPAISIICYFPLHPMESKTCVACRGSTGARMRMILACFAQALQRSARRVYRRFLHAFTEVMAIGTIRNRLDEYSDLNISFYQAIITLSTSQSLATMTESVVINMCAIRARTSGENDRA